MTRKPIKTLTCPCCGGRTKGRQWWNQDTGTGLCAPCYWWIKGRGATEVEMRENYGVPGIHHSLELV